MLSLKIKNIKKFMSLLLASNAFDECLLSEVTIVTNATIRIDGTIPNGFYSDEDLEALGLKSARYLPYALIKPTCFELIKGKRTPVSFKFVFFLPQKTVNAILKSTQLDIDVSSVTNMCMICAFSEGMLSVTCGISYNTFVLGHDLDKALDNYVKTFLNMAQIDYEDNF